MEDGYYSIRPMHKLDMGLNYASGNVNITGIGTTDSLSGVTSTTRWKISHESTGYVFMNNGSQSRALYPSGGSSSAGASVVATTYSSSNTAFRWTMEKVTSVPNQLHIYNSETGLLDDNAVRTIRPGQTLTLAALGIDVGVTSCNSNDQTVTWSSDDPQIASVNSSTGTVTAGSTKCKATTITATSALGVSTTYIICVTPVTLEDQPNEYWCWFATARMLAENYAGTLDGTLESDAVDMNVGAEDDGEPIKIKNAALAFSDMVPDLHHTMRYNAGSSTGIDLALKKDALISSLNQGHAVAVCIRYYALGDGSSGHAVLIAGYANVSGNYIFLIFDPSPVGEGSIYTATYEQIRKGSFGQSAQHVWCGGVLDYSIGSVTENWDVVS